MVCCMGKGMELTLHCEEMRVTGSIGVKLGMNYLVWSWDRG